MTGLEYVNRILQKYIINKNKIIEYKNLFTPYILKWANEYLNDIKISGSSAKGTSVSNGTDIDLFRGCTR